MGRCLWSCRCTMELDVDIVFTSFLFVRLFMNSPGYQCWSASFYKLKLFFNCKPIWKHLSYKILKLTNFFPFNYTTDFKSVIKVSLFFFRFHPNSLTTLLRKGCSCVVVAGREGLHGYKKLEIIKCRKKQLFLVCSRECLVYVELVKGTQRKVIHNCTSRVHIKNSENLINCFCISYLSDISRLRAPVNFWN